ncbi:hypothetical protein [Actinokineospora sp.]|uniref:hypothetical protein n=1 Tax=Actinokineospora sp. TaxID=1872133 RepID=UPI0040380E1C
MDFWKTLLVLLKRWYVALPVFAVSLGAAGAVYAAMPMHYESTGVLVLTSPASGPTSVADKVNGQTNPLLAFESSLAISASIVIQSINTPEVVKALGADKPDHTFVLSGGAEGGPFISVKTESASEEGSRELVVQVLDRVKAELTKRQEALRAPASTFIGVDDVVPPTKPEPLRGGKLRAAGVALVLGLAASLAAVFGVESYQSRRRKRDADEPDDDEPRPTKDTGEKRPDPEPETRVPTSSPLPVRGAQRAPVAERAHRVRQVEPQTNGQPVKATNGQPQAAANGTPVNGTAKTGTPKTGTLPTTPNGTTPNGKAPAGGRPANWPADEWREPPTLRIKPAQTPPDQRG